MGSFSHISIDATGKVVQIFRPVDGDEAHLTSLLPSTQTLVAWTGDDPPFATARPGTCWHYVDGAIVADETECDALESQETKTKLIALYQQRAAIESAAAAQPALDFAPELAALDAEIATVASGG